MRENIVALSNPLKPMDWFTVEEGQKMSSAFFVFVVDDDERNMRGITMQK